MSSVCTCNAGLPFSLHSIIVHTRRVTIACGPAPLHQHLYILAHSRVNASKRRHNKKNMRNNVSANASKHVREVVAKIIRPQTIAQSTRCSDKLSHASERADIRKPHWQATEVTNDTCSCQTMATLLQIWARFQRDIWDHVHAMSSITSLHITM
jgi:hypothetical protein